MREGADVYKKFSSVQSLKAPSFDALCGEARPPEECGYGLRFISLSSDLQNLMVRQNQRSQTHYTVPVKNILRVIIPTETLRIIRTQKENHEGNEVSKQDDLHLKNWNRRFGDLDESLGNLIGNLGVVEGVGPSVNLMVKNGILNRECAIYRAKCMACNYYPFSFALCEEGRLDFISTSYKCLKEWAVGLNALISNKKLVDKLSIKINI